VSTHPTQEPNPIRPWQTGMYKPSGHKVYYYPDWPAYANRETYAEVANNEEAYNLACKMNAKTRDMCREFEQHPTCTPEELHTHFSSLQQQIDAKLDLYVKQAKKATADFKEIVPLLDRMQEMLSQWGKLRALMDDAKLPTWTAWFEAFRARLHEDVTIRTIQRKLREYRGEVKKPEHNHLHIDRCLLKQMRELAWDARYFADKSVTERLPEFAPDDPKKKQEWDRKMRDWQGLVGSISKRALTLEQEIERRNANPGLQLTQGEILIINRKRYRIAESVTADAITKTKTKGQYRIVLLACEAPYKLRKREECPECGYTLDVTDGKFGQHNYMPPRCNEFCPMSKRPVVLDEWGKVVNTARSTKKKAASAKAFAVNRSSAGVG